ncbi:MAG TPA: NAD(P)(+) transhydrogenase (Re/Si-specific) subunit alpha, partial [Nitrospiria bacterium]|nr:NAD(P)(+) transhydrogenase (Re/Si-specific) subunit alpha [Nitrospiria bacterium]
MPKKKPLDDEELHMIIGVVKESFPGERRVALIPAVVPNLTKAGLEVLVENGAGQEAGYPDAAYQEKGARIAKDRGEVLGSADVLVQVRGFGANPEAGKADLAKQKKDQVVIGFLEPLSAPDSAKELAQKGVA